MPTLQRSWRQTGLLTVFLAAIVIWFLDQLSGFAALDGIAYGACLKIKGRFFQVAPQVVLIYVDRWQLDSNDEFLPSVVEKLGEQGVALVGISFPPERLPASSACPTLNERTLFGRLAARNPSDRQLEILPGAALSLKESPVGLVMLPPVRDGVYRSQFRTYYTKQGRVESFEALMAKRLTTGKSISVDNEYRIHFAGGPGSLPHITASDVMADRCVPELVQGRAALVGLAPMPGDPKISTPTTNPYNKMSALEFHGHALNTLLTNQAINGLGPVLKLALLLATSLTTLVICQPLRLPTVLYLGVPVLAVQTGMATLLLWSHCIWVPLVPIATLQIVCLGSIHARKNDLLHLGLRQLRLDLGRRMKNGWTSHSYSSGNSWPEIVTFMKQSLGVARMLALEVDRRSFGLRVVGSFNCDDVDSHEQRSDYRETPYVWATEARVPIRLKDRAVSYFHGPNVEQEQFLVPLLFGAQLFGFLVVAIESHHLQSIADFETLLREHAEQVVEWLRCRQMGFRGQRLENGLYRVLTDPPEKKYLSDLAETTNILERRLSKLENCFEMTDVGMAIYDIFGRLMIANARMSAIVQQQGPCLGELTPTDFVSLFTKQSIEKSRAVVRGVIMDKRPESINVELPDQNGSFQMNLRPLTVEPGQVADTFQEPSAFRVNGLLCEMINQTPIMKVYRRRDALAEHLGSSIRNHLAAVEFATALLANEDQQPKREGYQKMIHQKITQAAASLTETQNLARKITCDEEAWQSFEPQHALQAAINSIQPTAEARGITIRLRRPQLPSRVYGEFRRLQNAFESLLNLLLTDARDNTTIEVNVDERVGEVFYTLSNSGHGVPADELRRYLESDDDHEDDRQLHEATEWIESWGGHVTASSQVGIGTVVQFRMNRSAETSTGKLPTSKE